VPQQDSTEHDTRCPICGHLVDEFGLEEVVQHPDPVQEALAKN